MIRYSLDCRNGHEFEAWFRSSADYDDQRQRGIVLCPTCGSPDVDKAIMAPNVFARGQVGNQPGSSNNEQKRSGQPVPATNLTELNAPAPVKMLDAMRQYRKLVTENADNVGDKFADEARKIHYQEAPARGIYGNATPEEVRELYDEGVEVSPLPVLPEDNN